MNDWNGITIWYPELPPTANKLYFRGTQLKTPAREYRERFRAYVQQHHGHELQQIPSPNDQEQRLVKRKAGKKTVEKEAFVDVRTKDPNLLFGLDLTFYMNCLTSWGDPNLPKSRRADFRFQKVDVTNRIKFLEDCVKYAMDIDDSLTFYSQQSKIHSFDIEGVYIRYYRVDPGVFNVPVIT